MIIIEVIPYRSFKEKINITKQYDRLGKIEIFKGYIVIEMVKRRDVIECS